MLNAGQLLLYIKVIKREQKLVLMMMWCMWELIWLIMMDACLAGVKIKKKEKERENVEGMIINKMCLHVDFSQLESHCKRDCV